MHFNIFALVATVLSAVLFRGLYRRIIRRKSSSASWFCPCKCLEVLSLWLVGPGSVKGFCDQPCEAAAGLLLTAGGRVF